jgi:enoyl-CoA hydratase/carnithine racemase
VDDSDARYAELLALSARQFDTDEAREGARSFAEKRPPSWRAAG